MTQVDYLLQQPFTLSLSSGFFGFFAHTGFVMALKEKDITPKLVVGSSAGALVGACFASGLDPLEMARVFTSIKKNDFWDVALGFGLLRGEKMEKMLAPYVSADFSHTPIPLQISVFDIFSFKTKTLNSGSVAKACRASCAVPGLFHPVRINQRVYLDGGIADKMGLAAVDRNAMILCHNLEDLGGFELGKGSRKHFSRFQQFQLKNIPRSGPNRLHLGPDIISEAYKQTLKWLETPVNPHIAANIDLTL